MSFLIEKIKQSCFVHPITFLNVADTSDTIRYCKIWLAMPEEPFINCVKQRLISKGLFDVIVWIIKTAISALASFYRLGQKSLKKVLLFFWPKLLFFLEKLETITRRESNKSQKIFIQICVFQRIIFVAKEIIVLKAYF